MTKTMLERHPLSACFGDMSPDEFIEMQDSIGALGVRDPVELFEGMVLDGWQRYSTAYSLGLDCPLKEYTGTVEDAKSHVLAKHTRRNSDKGRRALAVAAVNAYTAPGAVSKTIPEQAAMAQVSQRTMEQAAAVIRKAIPTVKQAAMDGDISLKQAEKIANRPKREQAKALREPPQPKPVWRPAGSPPLPRPTVGPSQQAYDELREKHAILVEELEAVQARLAVQFMEGTDEERLAASALIEELRTENKTLKAEISAIKGSRNHYMEECNELKKQCALYRNQLAKHQK